MGRKESTRCYYRHTNTREGRIATTEQTRNFSFRTGEESGACSNPGTIGAVVSFGVAILGIDEVREEGLEFAPLLGMIAASFITGYIALIWLFAVLRKGQFRWFAPYLWAIAAITLIKVAMG